MSLAVDIAASFASTQPREAAARLEVAADVDARELLDVLDPQTGVAIVETMTPGAGARVLGLAAESTASAIFDALPLERAARLARAADGPLRERLLATPSAKRQEELTRLLRYPEGRAGALMEPRVLSFLESATVGDTLDALGRRSSELRYYVYTVDGDDRLVGVTTLRQLFGADPRTELRAVASRPVEHVSARSSRRALAEHPGWQRFPVLPVVDESNRLIGVLQYETYRRLSGEPSPEDEGSAVGAMLALGELFWLAASTLVEGGGDGRSSEPERAS